MPKTVRNWITKRFAPGLSVFFPAFNDAPSLPGLLAKTFETLHRLAEDFEVIVVNDGSADDTADVLERLRVQYSPHLRIVTHPVNRGYGAALRSGFEAATKEFVFYTDGDGQYDPRELELLLDAAGSDTGLVNGYKKQRSDAAHRILIGKTYNWIVRRMFGVRVRDVDCDFRLIRRRYLDPSKLESTGGTICIELVRHLERNGAPLVEVPVTHLPRLHGKSQFFRFRSLVNTFIQLWTLYANLVLKPAFQRHSFAAGAAALFTAVAALSFLAYGRTLSLPFISDDYLQIHLGREYGPVSGWSSLFSDALYRCRATSLILTHWTEQLFGLNSLRFNLSNLGVHIVNCCLVALLGFWRPIGWRVSSAAACFFAVSQRHNEAVVWYASLPELLVFLFGMASFLAWIWWLEEGRSKALAYTASLMLYGLALFSKESAVVVGPLCALAAFWRTRRIPVAALSPFAVFAALYFFGAYATRDTHLHFNDGTFSLSAPFWLVLPRSIGSILWVWGYAALAVILALKPARWKEIVGGSVLWMVITLLPYSFLSYMTRVPSRHTYWASAALAVLAGFAFVVLKDWAATRQPRPVARWLVPALAGIVIFHESGYIWLYKYRQYALRAEPTEKLLAAAKRTNAPQQPLIYAKCFPYTADVGRRALQVNSVNAVLVTGPAASVGADEALDLCNQVAHE